MNTIIIVLSATILLGSFIYLIYNYYTKPWDKYIDEISSTPKGIISTRIKLLVKSMMEDSPAYISYKNYYIRKSPFDGEICVWLNNKIIFTIERIYLGLYRSKWEIDLTDEQCLNIYNHIVEIYNELNIRKAINKQILNNIISNKPYSDISIREEVIKSIELTKYATMEDIMEDLEIIKRIVGEK